MALQDPLLTAVGRIYDSVNESFDHAMALAAISAATDETGLFLAEIRPFLGHQKMLGFHNVPEAAVNAMLKSFGDTTSNSMIRNLPRIPVGTPVLRRAFVSDDDYYKSRMYLETSAPWGLHSEGVSILKKNLVGAIGCGFMRHPGQDEIGAEHISKLAFLNRHYRRAMAMHQRLSEFEKQIVLANNVLDLVEFGLLLYDYTRVPVFVNKSAKRIFANTDGLELTHHGLRIHDRLARSRFKALLEGVSDEKLPLAARIGGVVQVRRPSRKRSYNLMLVPLLPDNIIGVSKSTTAVLIFDPSLKQTTAIKLFTTAYKLTKTESVLALQLAQGDTIEAFAKARKISIHTARSQLRSIYAKTGTSRQGELVSLLLQMTAGIDLG